MDFEIGRGTATIILGVFGIYTLTLIVIGIYSRRKMKAAAASEYVDEFYTGGRDMGGIVVAMMVAAGICSAGTFLGGPGMAYKIGITWVVIVMAQAFVNFLVMGGVGKKIGIVARRINSQSFVSLLYHRYNKNKFISVLGAGTIVIFLGCYTASQFIGGGRLFETMTGAPYWLGLVIFTVVVLVTAVLGGVNGVASAIVFQGAIMTFAVLALFIYGINYVGGAENAIGKIQEIDPALVTGDYFSFEMTFSYWILFGITVAAMPQAVMGALTYKNTNAMNTSVKIGVVLVSVWTFMLLLLGFLSRSVMPDLDVSDYALPALAVTALPPWVAGLTLAGVCGAMQSTVGSLVLIISSAIVKDLYQAVFNPKATTKKLKQVSITATVIICFVVFAGSLFPPDALQLIVMFAVGGVVSAFFWPMLLGLYWRRCNEEGAVISMVLGLVTYVVGTLEVLPINFGMDPIIVSLVVSFIGIVVGSVVTPKPPYGIVRTWFGKEYCEELDG